MMLTIGLIAAVLFVGTLLLLAFRPEPPRAAGPRSKTDRPSSNSDSQGVSTFPPAAKRSAAPPARETGAQAQSPANDDSIPGLPANYREHEVARHLDSRGYATLKDLYFHPGSPRLRDDATGELAVIAALMRDDASAAFEIEGCSNGNEFLARDRAVAVIDQLVQVYGVDRRRLVGRGRSAGTSNIARNRRVQVIRRT